MVAGGLEGMYRFVNRIWRSVFDMSGEAWLTGRQLLSVYDKSLGLMMLPAGGQS